MTELLDLIGTDTRLKRVAGTGGGEYAGPCPRCGGRDRFHVWPEERRFWCRGCDWRGDDITYLRDLRGLSFAEAKVQARGEQPDRTQPISERPSLEPPPADWQSRAREVIDTCAAALWSPAGAKALAWLHARGLTDDTLRVWTVGYNEQARKLAGLYVERGLIIPCQATGEVWYVNVRRPAGRPKYKKVQGSRAALFGVDHLKGAPDMFVVEGEFDAMLLHQQVGRLADVLTLGSASGHVADEQVGYLLAAERFYLATDADAEGESAAERWRQLVGRRGLRVQPPGGHKDVTAAWQAGADLSWWVRQVVECYRAGLPMPVMYVSADDEDAWWAAQACALDLILEQLDGRPSVETDDHTA